MNGPMKDNSYLYFALWGWHYTTIIRNVTANGALNHVLPEEGCIAHRNM